MSRIEDRIDKNTPFAYYGIDELIELLRRKKESIEFHQLWGLNYA